MPNGAVVFYIRIQRYNHLYQEATFLDGDERDEWNHVLSWPQIKSIQPSEQY